MSDVLVVRLHGQDVGEIVRFPGGRIQLEFYPEYTARRDRPTLSLSFLDEDGDVTGGGQHTNNGEVPDFFSNLLPEGELRSYLADKAGVPETREFELLELLGGDLPGAVEVVNERPEGDRGRFAHSAPARRVSPPPDALRFSLAGVQLKFSAVEKASGGLTIPASGMGGDWILKLPSLRFDAIPENEYSIMSLAGKVGIEVPETRLIPMHGIEGLPSEALDGRMADANVLMVRRFDRTEDRGKVHAEDFAQALTLKPRHKYERFTYASFARVLAVFSDERSVNEFSRRLMYGALTGNADLHAKNWSLIYRDGRTPELSPAYDLLCTTRHMRTDRMALRLGSTMRWPDLTLNDFAAVAEAAHADPVAFVGAAVETAERFRDIWREEVKSLPVPDAVRSAIETQLARVPAIAEAAQPPRRRIRKPGP